jgi:anti-sigma factor RsiW
MSSESEKIESSLEEQLVAYLDGELDAEDRRRLEERLAAEPEVREALNRLERTWDMLDELGSTPVGEGFTRTTLEMVTVAAEEEVKQELAAAPVRRRRRWWLACAGMLVAASAGFLAVFFGMPNPNRQLLQDLPVLENLDEYQQTEDIEFLRMLKEKELFAKEESNGP